MKKMTRRQAVVTAGVTAAAALGISVPRVNAADPKIEAPMHPAPGSKVRAPFVAFGKCTDVKHLHARLKKDKMEHHLRCCVVPIPDTKEFFWYVRFDGRYEPGDGYSINVRDVYGVAKEQEIKLSIKEPTYGIDIQYPPDDPAGTNPVPCNLTAYGPDTDNVSEASYLLWKDGSTGHGSTMDVVQGTWQITFLNLQPKTEYHLKVYDIDDPTGKTHAFWTQG
jgi:hypothetical protein